PDSPLSHLAGKNPRVDRRHDRRPLSETELRMVLEAVQASRDEFRGLDGRARHMLYVTACVTGFRASELAILTPGSFDLGARPALATVRAGYTKNRKAVSQPLPADVAMALGAFLEAKPTDQPLWPGTWHTRAAEMIRADLEAVGIPYTVDGPDGPLFADFHALRHSYVALLDQSGASLKQAMQLARHGAPTL